VVGRVTELGADVTELCLGQRVAWPGCTAPAASAALSQRARNLCESAYFTGWTADGGFATEIKAPAGFTYPMPDGLSDLAAAPLLSPESSAIARSSSPHHLMGRCAYRFVRVRCRRPHRHPGGPRPRRRVYVCTRDRERHQALASELGAAWVGGTVDRRRSGSMRPSSSRPRARSCYCPGRAGSGWHAGPGRHPYVAHPELSL